MRIMLGVKLLNFLVDIVFDSPNGHCSILHNHVAGARVSVVGQANASAVGDRKAFESADKWTMYVVRK